MAKSETERLMKDAEAMAFAMMESDKALNSIAAMMTMTTILPSIEEVLAEPPFSMDDPQIANIKGMVMGGMVLGICTMVKVSGEQWKNGARKEQLLEALREWRSGEPEIVGSDNGWLDELAESLCNKLRLYPPYFGSEEMND